MEDSGRTPKVYRFNPGIYPLKLWIAITDKDLPGFDKQSDFDDQYAAITEQCRYKDGCYGVMVRFSDIKYFNDKNCYHESGHVVNKMFDMLGMKPDFENDEAYCYLLGWVGQCMGKVREKLNKKDDD